ncbi:unnamed protein product [Spirodela intermedia]|uniref:Uncharacterized protein n=1 Tax=Spirodela intermedia TaxID=51605 RepID=A0A7I8LDK1_SPIIN|nr:unnamed protein product [Spirodela intermedia]
MGCASSKAVTRSRSFREESGHSFRRTSGVVPTLGSLLAAMSGGDGNLVALLSAAPRKLTAAKNAAPDTSKPSDALAGEPTIPETIDAQELMADLQENGESFRAAEDGGAGGGWKGPRRKGVAGEPPALRIPSGFEFSRSGDLGEWLKGGGVVFSPGSYATPRFGNCTARGGGGGGAAAAEGDWFDQQLVTELEEAMAVLSAEEEKILESFPGGFQEEDGEEDFVGLRSQIDS